MATVEKPECTLTPRDISKLEELKKLEAQVKVMKAEIKAKLDVQPEGIYTIGARMIKLKRINKTTIEYKQMVVDALGEEFITEHAEEYGKPSSYVTATLLGRK